MMPDQRDGSTDHRQVKLRPDQAQLDFPTGLHIRVTLLPSLMIRDSGLQTGGSSSATASIVEGMTIIICTQSTLRGNANVLKGWRVGKWKHLYSRPLRHRPDAYGFLLGMMASTIL